MVKPFDFSKFRKKLTKNIDGLSIGFHDPVDWIHTGNYALNYLISGDFYKGVPLGKVTMFAGESGSGKSLVVSGNLAKNAQEQGCFVVMLDSENALDSNWLKALDVDTSEDKLLKINVSMIDNVAQILADFIKGYKEENVDKEYKDCPKVLIIIDSLGMLLSPTDIAQFEKGELKGDLGRKPKALTALIRNTVNNIAPYPIGFIVTNHTYASQDMFDPEDKIAGGCITFGHDIQMADNTLKDISEVKINDEVKTLGGHNNRVTQTFNYNDKEVFEIELENGDLLQATGEHRFLVETNDKKLLWETVETLKEGDEILKVI